MELQVFPECFIRIKHIYDQSRRTKTAVSWQSSLFFFTCKKSFSLFIYFYSLSPGVILHSFQSCFISIDFSSPPGLNYFHSRGKRNTSEPKNCDVSNIAAFTVISSLGVRLQDFGPESKIRVWPYLRGFVCIETSIFRIYNPASYSWKICNFLCFSR